MPEILGLTFDNPKTKCRAQIISTDFVNIRYGYKRLLLLSFQTIVNDLSMNYVIFFNFTFKNNSKIKSLIRIDGTFLNVAVSLTDSKFIANSIK